MRKKSLVINIRLMPKFRTLEPKKQTIAVHIFPNIERSIDNETIEFG